jgi:hypothetical protein
LAAHSQPMQPDSKLGYSGIDADSERAAS